MIILAHRGAWHVHEEQNTPLAFERSLQNGWGIETDVRDFNGKLVIAHDMPSDKSWLFSSFLQLCKEFDDNSTLAINIKADGLQQPLLECLEDQNINNYFVFDMSVPDSLNYIRMGLKAFTRHSEIEPEPTLYKDVTGVWLDNFYSDWFSEEIIDRHLTHGKVVSIVSPELHGRPHKQCWQMINQYLAKNKLATGQLMICTDYPKDAEDYFNGKD